MKHIRILNIIVSWTEEGIEIEGDQRHVEICLLDMGLDESSKGVVTPCDKSKKSKYSARKLEACGGKKYRGLTTRSNYLGQDRSDIQYAVKELSRCMSDPDEDDMGRLKRVVRYLKDAPRFVNRCNYQEKPEGVGAWADTDFAGCERTRKSTSGGMIMHGTHAIKTWSVNQAVIALSSVGARSIMG